jgi:hypothetical protein
VFELPINYLGSKAPRPGPRGGVSRGLTQQEDAGGLSKMLLDVKILTLAMEPHLW